MIERSRNHRQQRLRSGALNAMKTLDDRGGIGVALPSMQWPIIGR